MAIVIDVQLADSKGTSAAIERLEKAVTRLEATVDKMTQGFKDAASLTNTIAKNLQDAATAAGKVRISGGGGGGGQSRTSEATQRVARAPKPKITQPHWLMDQLKDRVMAGDDIDAADVYLRAKQVADKLTRAKKHATGDTGDPKDRTRYFNFMGMEIPLPLGRDMASFGRSVAGGQLNMGAMGRILAMLPKLGPVIMGITAATTGVLLLAKASYEGYKALTDFTRTMSSIGGSPGDVAGARSIAGGLGLSPQAAAELGARISSDSVARMIAARAGVPGLRGYFGDINDAKAFRKIAAYLGSLTYDRARREAVGLGAPELATIALMNKSLQERMISPSAIGASMTDQRFGARTQGEMRVLTDEIEELGRVLSSPGVRAAPATIRTVSSAINMFNHILANKMAGTNAFFEGVDKLVTKVQDMFQGKDSVRERELKELKEINKGIQALNDGVYGGGPRARKAQTGLMGPEVERAIQARAIGGGVGI